MIKTLIAIINDFSGGQDTKTPLISMGLNKSPNMRNFHCAGVKERLIKRNGYSKVNSSAIGTDELDTYYPPGYQTYDYPCRDTVGRTQIAQGFKPKTSSTVQKVRLWLKKTGSPTGNINIEIQTNSSGLPSGTAVTNGTSVNIDVSTLTTSYAWYTFTFSTQPSLTSGTQYHIVLQGSNTINGTAYAIWGADDYDAIFPDGSMAIYNGTTWGSDSASSYDAIFEVYISGGTGGNDGFALWDFSSRNMLLGLFGTTLYKMNKNSVGTPDGVWDNLYNVSKELDYMEYSTNALAQAAYVTNSGAYTSQYPPAQNDTYVKSTSEYGTSFKPYFATDPAKSLTGTNSNNQWVAGGTTNQRFHIDLGSAKIIERIYYENGHNSGANTNDGAGNFTFWGSNDASAFATLTYGTDTGWTQITPAVSTFTGHSNSDVADPKYITVTNTTAYRYYAFKFADTIGAPTYGIQVRRIELQTNSLQVSSESTIKNQGTYALKGAAAITGSLNKTLTRTVSPVINLSNENTLKFDMRASRAGSNIKIGIHDSGGTTTEITPNITATDVWQTMTWDISSVANANKDAIDSIIITIINADAENTVYFDNFYAASLLTTSRYWTFADWQSGRALINTDVGLFTYIGTGDISLVSAAPIGKFIVIFKNYVFMAGIRGLPNIIRYSDLSDYATWTSSNTLNVNTNDGDVITGIRILKGKLYVFKRYSIHRITYLGSNPTFQVDQILGVGCPAHYTIKEVELGGDMGTVLVFLTTDKKLAIFDGYNVQIINDSLTEETNDLFGVSDDQPISFSDMNLVYADLFHAVVKSDTSEYILYCVLGNDTSINYAFVFDYKTGGVYPYDGQPFASSCYAISTSKSKILYCAGYSGYMWQMESGNSDDGSAINAYWVSAKIKPSLVSLLTKALLLGINFKETSSQGTLNAYFQFRIDWNVSWTTAEAFAYNQTDNLTFGKTALFDIGTIENMLQIKISDNSTQAPITLYGADLYGIPGLGVSVGEKAVV